MLIDTKLIRQKILDLAIHGKLVPQDPNDEPASELLKRIHAEKTALVKSGKIKKEKLLPPISKAEIPFDIPESWEWVRLETVSLCIQYGYTASASAVGNARMLRITDIHDNSVSWKDVPFCTVNEEEFQNYQLHNRDILIARTGGTIGKTYIVNDLSEKAVFASYLIRIVPALKLNEKYLKFFMESPLYWSELKSASAGTGQPNVNGQALRLLFLPLPPLAEQERIVAKVEALMNEVDTIERETENLNRKFAQTKEKVLDLAIRGKLVPQDPNDEPASELLKRIHAEKASLIKSGKLKKEKPLPPITKDEIPFDIPASWSWVRLSDLGSFAGGKTPSMNHKEFWDGNILWVTSKDMKTKYINNTGLMVTRKGAAELQLLVPGTVLMVTRSGILRHTFPVAINQKECTINQDLKSLIPFIPSMSEFIYILLKGFEGRILSDYKKSGTTVESIIWDKFKTIVLPLPPLAEQKRIATKVESIMNAIEKITTN